MKRRKLSGYAYKFATPREGKMFEDLKEFFLSEGQKCVPELIYEYWDIPVGSREYDTYDRKTRRILSNLKHFFRRTSANTLERFSDKDDDIKLSLMAIRKCDKHSKCREYKLIVTEDEARIVGRLSVKRIKRHILANERRMDEGGKLFPGLKRALKSETVTLLTLPEGQNGN